MPQSKAPTAIKPRVSVEWQALVLATMIGVLASCTNVPRTTSAFVPSEGGPGRNMGDLSSRNSGGPGTSCTPSACGSAP